jgi:hypothetical protein
MFITRRPFRRRTFGRRLQSKRILIRQTRAAQNTGAITAGTGFTGTNILKSDTFLGNNADKMAKDITVHRIELWNQVLLTSGTPSAGKWVEIAEYVYEAQFGSQASTEPWAGAFFGTINQMSGSTPVSNVPQFMYRNFFTVPGYGGGGAAAGITYVRQYPATIKTKRKLSVNNGDGLVFRLEINNQDSVSLTYQWIFWALLRYSVRT